MRLLVIHQNFPGQFGHLVRTWSQRPGWDVRGIGRDTAPGVRGFDKLLRYKLARHVRTDQHLYLRQMEASTLHGQAAARAMLALKQSGFTPDTILAHPGWGETLFAKDVFPNARLVHLCEWYYSAEGADLGFDPEFPLSFDDRARIRVWNAQHALDLIQCDAAVSPTHWQRSRYPEVTVADLAAAMRDDERSVAWSRWKDDRKEETDGLVLAHRCASPAEHGRAGAIVREAERPRVRPPARFANRPVHHRSWIWDAVQSLSKAWRERPVIGRRWRAMAAGSAIYAHPHPNWAARSSQVLCRVKTTQTSQWGRVHCDVS